MSKRAEQPETDPRFPSGRWIGFWIQKYHPIGKYRTEVTLTFSEGRITGKGKDWVGKYSIQGHYNLEDGRCYWNKRYAGAHNVLYEGFNEGRGIWGTWVVPLNPEGPEYRGGFHLWPEDMPDPSAAEGEETLAAPSPGWESEAEEE